MGLRLLVVQRVAPRVCKARYGSTSPSGNQLLLVGFLWLYKVTEGGRDTLWGCAEES